MKKKLKIASLSLSFHKLFRAGSALTPLSVSVHLKTTKLTYMCSQSAIIIYTCGKYSDIHTT